MAMFSTYEAKSTYLAYNMDNEPNGPCPAIVSPHEGAQWQEEPPGYVHEESMEVEVGELTV